MKIYIQADYFETEFERQFAGIITDIPYKGAITGALMEKEFSFENFMQKTDKETEKDAFLITFTNFLCASDLIAASKRTSWKYHTHQIWDKQPVRTWISWGHPLRHTEYILYFKKGNFKFSFKTGKIKAAYKRSSFGGKLKNAQQPNKNRVSYPMYSEIMDFKSTHKKVHPTEKPKKFSSYFKMIVGDGFVLDPFMGSGNLLSAFPESIGVDLVDYNKPKGVDLRKFI